MSTKKVIKTYKNLNRHNAKDLGFLGNFEFAKDEVISPSGVDIIEVKSSLIISSKSKRLRRFEKTTYQKKSDTVDIEIYEC